MAAKLSATFLLLKRKFHNVKTFWIYKILDYFNIPGKEGNKKVEEFCFGFFFSFTETPLTLKDRFKHVHVSPVRIKIVKFPI